MQSFDHTSCSPESLYCSAVRLHCFNSRVHGDTGEVLGCAVRADLTVTFVGLKTGLFLNNGPDHCGAIVFADLDIPAACRDGCAPEYRRIDDEQLLQALPRRRRAATRELPSHSRTAP